MNISCVGAYSYSIYFPLWRIKHKMNIMKFDASAISAAQC